VLGVGAEQAIPISLIVIGIASAAGAAYVLVDTAFLHTTTA
jgi:hypothetical protein